MVSYRRLLSAVEAELCEPKIAPHHRTELSHALHDFLPDFQSFLKYPVPRSKDRAKVASRVVGLPNSPPTFDVQDVQIALKLSDDFNLNESYCASLLISAHQEWNLLGRGPLEILRLSAGLWFTERRALVSSLQLLLQAVVLDDKLDPDLVMEIRVYVERLLVAGLQARLVTLIKELNQEEPAGLGGHGVEPSLINSRGAVVQRRSVIHMERLSLCHCLFLTCHVVPINAQEVKDLYALLKECSADESLPQDVVKLQITYTIMFSLTNSLVLNALGGPQDMSSMLALDTGFCRDFQQLITDEGDVGYITEGFTGVIRFVWAVYLMLTKCSSEVVSAGSSYETDGSVCLCLSRACESNVFEFLTIQILQTATFQNDKKVQRFKYLTALCKLLSSFFTFPAGREKIMELKHTNLVPLGTQKVHVIGSILDGVSRVHQQDMEELQAKPFISLLNLVGEIYKREPECIIDNEDLWSFVQFVGEDHTSYCTLVAFLNLLTALAGCEEGANNVYQLLQKKTFRTLGWKTLFDSLDVYDQRCRQSLQASGPIFPVFQEEDAWALESYLKVLGQVMQRGNEMKRSQWFTDIEPLFKLLSHENVPPYLKGALRNTITAFVPVSPVMKDKVWSLLEQYDLPLVAKHHITNGSVQEPSTLDQHPSTLSYLKLINVLIASKLDVADRGERYIGMFRFVRDQVFAPYNQRAFANAVEKWELVVEALRHFEITLRMYQLTDEEIENIAYDLHIPEKSLQGMAASSLAAGITTEIPVMELMKDLMSGKVIFCNVMSILMSGVNSLIEQRTGYLYGPVLEEAIVLCFHILVLALSYDASSAEYWRFMYEHNIQQIVTILEYVRYEFSPSIQRSSILIMKLLSARMPRLVSLLVEAGVAEKLVEDYAACLKARAADTHVSENPDEDVGCLILQLLLTNLCEPAPNVAHLLLGFNVSQPVERTILQPNCHFSCLQVILDVLDRLARPEVNGGLHELGFLLMSQLCVDPVTCGPMVELLKGGKHDFYPKRISESRQPMSMDKGKGPASGPHPGFSEAHDQDLQISGAAAAAMPAIPGSSRADIGFLNPTPLATRCTTKQKQIPGGGSIGALGSTWIQRLFPEVLGEDTKPWMEKEKGPAPTHEEIVPLLLKDTFSIESPGFQTESPIEVQGQGGETYGKDISRTVIKEGSGKQPMFSHSCTSQFSSAQPAKEGPACPVDVTRANVGGRPQSISKDLSEIKNQPCSTLGGQVVSNIRDDSGCIRVDLSGKPSSDTPRELSGGQKIVGPQQVSVNPAMKSSRFKKELNCRPGNLQIIASGRIIGEHQSPIGVNSACPGLPASSFPSQMMVLQSSHGTTSMKPPRYASQGENSILFPTVRRPVPCHLQSMEKDNISRMHMREDGEGAQKEIVHPHVPSLGNHPLGISDSVTSLQQQEWCQTAPGLSGSGKRSVTKAIGSSASPRAAKSELQFPGGSKAISDWDPQPVCGAEAAEANLRTHIDMEELSGCHARHDNAKEKEMVSLGSSSLPPLSLFAPFKHNKERRRLESRGKAKVDPTVSGESLLTPLYPSHGDRDHGRDMQYGAGLLKEKFESTIFAPYKPSTDSQDSSRTKKPEKFHDPELLLQKSSVLTPLFVALKTADEHNEPSGSSSKTESLPLDLMDADDQTTGDARGEDPATMPDRRLETKTELASDQLHSAGEHPGVYGHASSVHSSSPWIQKGNLLFDREAGRSTEALGSGLYEEGNQQASTAGLRRPVSREKRFILNTDAIELSSRRPSLHDELDKDRDGQAGKKDSSTTASFDLPRSVSQELRSPFQLDQDLQQQRLRVQTGVARDTGPYSASLCEASSGSSLPVLGSQQISGMPSQSIEKQFKYYGSKKSMVPIRHQEKEGSQQGRCKEETTSISGIKGSFEVRRHIVEVKDMDVERRTSSEHADGGDTCLDSLQQRQGVAFPERATGSNRVHLSGQNLGQGGEIKQQGEGYKLWADAPGDRPGRPSRKRCHEAGTKMSGSPVQFPETASSLNQGSIGPNGEICQRVSLTQSWLQRWMSSSKPNSSPLEDHHTVPGRSATERASTHAKNRKLVQDSCIQGEATNGAEQGMQEHRRSAEVEGGNSNFGASSAVTSKKISSFSPGFHSVPSAAAMALVGAARRRAIPYHLNELEQE